MHDSPGRYALLNVSTQTFCPINHREVFTTRAAALTAREFYLEASNDDFVVVEIQPA